MFVYVEDYYLHVDNIEGSNLYARWINILRRDLWVRCCFSILFNSYYCREFMEKDRPQSIKNTIDPRIKKASDENIVLRLTRYLLSVGHKQ